MHYKVVIVLYYVKRNPIANLRTCQTKGGNREYEDAEEEENTQDLEETWDISVREIQN